MKQLTALCLLALAPIIACADPVRNLAPRTLPVRSTATFTESATLAAGGLGLVLMGWAWRRSTRHTDSAR